LKSQQNTRFSFRREDLCEAGLIGFYYSVIQGHLILPSEISGRTLSYAQRKSAWEGKWTWDSFLAFAWNGAEGDCLISAVNYAPHQSQCYVLPEFPELTGRTVRLPDLMGPASYDRDGSELASRGLYLDMPPWGYQGFQVTTL
jgi:hypothetical protein